MYQNRKIHSGPQWQCGMVSDFHGKLLLLRHKHGIPQNGQIPNKDALSRAESLENSCTSLSYGCIPGMPVQ